MPWTPREFCAVTAVTTLIPCTPWASIVFRSAWIPAPPPESEPATVSTRAVGRALIGGRGSGRSPSRTSRADRRPGSPPARRRPPAPRPIARHPGGSGTEAGKVAARAWSSPPDRISWYGIRARRGGHGLQRLGHVERVPAEVDADARRRRHVTEIGEQPVGDVGHRRRPRLGGHGPRTVAQLRHPERLDHDPRRAEPAAQHDQTRGGPAQPAVDRDHVRRPGAGPQHRRTPVEDPQHGDRDGDVAGPGHVTADQIDPGRRRLLPEPGGEVQGPADLQVGRRREADQHGDRPSAHRLEVGDIHRDGLATDVGRGESSRGESAPLPPAHRSRRSPAATGRAPRRRRPGRPGRRRSAGRSAVIAAISGNSPTSPRVKVRSMLIATTKAPGLPRRGCTL